MKRAALATALALVLLAAGGSASAAAPAADRANAGSAKKKTKAGTRRCARRRSGRAAKRACRKKRRCSKRHRRKARSSKRRRTRSCKRRKRRKLAVLPAPPYVPPTPRPTPPTGGGTPAPPPRQVQVQAWEHYFTLSRPLVSSGSVTVELVNRGEDPHDLHLRREDGTGSEFTFAETLPAGREEQSLPLSAGYYYLWCNLLDHEELGMHARLRVQ